MRRWRCLPEPASMLDLDGPLSRSDREQLPLPKKKARRTLERGAWDVGEAALFSKVVRWGGSVAGGVGMLVWVQDASLARDGCSEDWGQG
jgi:hypothetical protein